MMLRIVTLSLIGWAHTQMIPGGINKALIHNNNVLFFIAAYSLLLKMLKFRSGNRITAEEALCDPYLRGLSLRSDEPSAAHPLRIEHEVGCWDLGPISI